MIPPAVAAGVDSPAVLGCCVYPPFPEIPPIPGTLIIQGLLPYHAGDVLIPKPGGGCTGVCAPLPRVCINTSTVISDGRPLAHIGDFLNIPAGCVHISVPTPVLIS